MESMITYHETEASVHYMRALVDGQETRMSIYPDGSLNVCVLNAMARVYRMASGRIFPTLDAALAAYKSERTKAAIRAGYALASQSWAGKPYPANT